MKTDWSEKTLVIAGCRWSGVTTHGGLLVAGLERAGIPAFYAEPPEPPIDLRGAVRVRWAAREIREADGHGVLVMARGPLREFVAAHAEGDEEAVAAAEGFCAPWDAVPTLFLDAHDDALDDRMRAAEMGPEALRLAYRERAEWRSLVGRRVDTSRPDFVVAREVLQWAMRSLGAFGPRRMEPLRSWRCDGGGR